MKCKFHHLALAMALCTCFGVPTSHADENDKRHTQIPYRVDSPDAEISFLRIAIGLGAAAAMLVGVLYFARRNGNGDKAGKRQYGRLNVVETRRLGQRSALHVVEFSGRSYLIAQSENGINCIASSSNSDESNPGCI